MSVRQWSAISSTVVTRHREDLAVRVLVADRGARRHREVVVQAGPALWSAGRRLYSSGLAGRNVSPMRYASTPRAHSRPSQIAHTTSDCPRRASPHANTPGTVVW